MSSKKTILVTGASGFVGAQMVDHLLEAGYAVKGTSRSAKASDLKNNCQHPDFHVIVIDDILKGDLSTALEDVECVIHVASPLAKGDNIVGDTVEGTLNVMRQAYAANVYKITVVGSISAAMTSPTELWDGNRVINDKDWNHITREEVEAPGRSPLLMYTGSKALSERAAWDFADAHPKLDLTYLIPPYIFGPLSPTQVITDPRTMLGSNGRLYQLILGPLAKYPPPAIPHCVDVRDVALAAVRLLKAKPSEPGEKRRILLWGGSFTWNEAVRHIAAARPELKARLLDGGEPQPEEKAPSARLDLSKAGEILGMTDFIGWKKTVEDTVDSLLRRESTWIS